MSRSESSADGVITFVDDESGYLGWLETNPHGFVVNSARNPAPNYLMLHRCSCHTINTDGRANWTNSGLIKTCSNSVHRLTQWAQEIVGGSLQPCAFCKPANETIAARDSSESRNDDIAMNASSIVATVEFESAQVRAAREIPDTIVTGCPQLDLAWTIYARKILASPILIPDTEGDLNWHAFLGHSLDMQGFRAAEFFGVDELTRSVPGFTPLKSLGIGVAELGALWEIEPIQNYLLARSKGEPLSATFDVLAEHGGKVGQALADAFRKFGRCRFASTVRACLQNAAALKPYGYSFRNWLMTECEKLGIAEFPPADFQAATNFKSLSVEMALRHQLENTFYQVGPALAPYMLCDWQLWLWNQRRTGVFANFKLDSFHQEFVKRFGRGVIPEDEPGFAQWWLSLYPELPPRLANECIWLGIENKDF